MPLRFKEKRVNQCDHDVVGACDGTDATSLSWFGWHSPLQKSPPFFFLFLVFREPKLYLTNKIRLAQGRSLFFGWAVSFWVGLRKKRTEGNHAWYFSTVSPRDSWTSDSWMLPGWTSQLLERVRSVFWARITALPYLHHDTDSKFLWQSTRRFIINMMMGMETRSTTGAFVVKNNKTINNSNVSMRLFGSTGEPDGRGDGIWDGGLVVSL